MAKNCWCDLPFHFPGEAAKHKRSEQTALAIMDALASAQKSGKKKKEKK